MIDNSNSNSALRAAVREAREASTGELLLRAARLWHEEALRRARQRFGLPGLRPSHMTLMPHLGPDGIRLGALAERLGVTKQAAGQLVDDLEAMGLVCRRADPSDGRGVLVALTDHGLRGTLAGLQELTAMEEELMATWQAGERAAFRAGLSALVARLGEAGG